MPSAFGGQARLTEDQLTADDARVLVAVLNNLRDLDIARQQGWYRIPLKRAPPRVGADYLAFYQTKAFGEDRWAINYYAPIRRFRIASRHTLLPDVPDHPRANDLYYKIEIGPLQSLPQPIPSRRLRRITFIPTTAERLLNAEEINDLWCGSDAEEKVWRAFKENSIIAERYYPLREGDDVGRIDFAVFCKEGRIAVLVQAEAPVQNIHILREQPNIDDYDLAVSGWTVIRLTSADVTRSLPSSVSVVLATITQYGGLLPYPKV